jgi:hypothetical protein
VPLRRQPPPEDEQRTGGPSVWGSLPDPINDKYLAALNEALRYLFAELREAFHQSGASTDREGALRAIEAVSKFLMLFRVVQDEQLHLPFAALDNALQALDQNVVLPLVTPKQRSGRGPATEGRQVSMGAAAYAVASLQRLGTNRQDACEAVAKELHACGVRPNRGSGILTARTVREWCDVVSVDYGRHTPAAQTFDELSAEFDMALNNLPPETARKFLLEKLTTTGRHWAQVDPITQKDS